jgi:HK97 family phage portal protein
MIFKIPFTNLHLGTKSAIANQRAVSYGLWGNTYGSLSAYLNDLRIDFQTLYNIYNNVVEVKMAIRKKQNACAKEGLAFYYDNAEKADASQDEQVKYFWEVFERYYTFSTMKDLWLRDEDVAGNAYWHLERANDGKIVGVNPVDPRSMFLSANKYGQIIEYVQRVSGHPEQTFKPDEIIHSVIDYSTRNPLLGVSPIESVVWDARADMAAQLASYYFYENNMVPSHLLIVNEDMTAKQAKDLKEKMKSEYGGADNKFKAGIIPFVKDIKTISPSQKEMQFLENRKFNAQKVSTAFGVDKFLLGYTEGVQRANGNIIRKEFYENTVRPYERYFEEVLNNELLPALGIENIKVEVKPSDYDDEDAVYNRSRADVAAGIITPNEARQMRGMAPSENEMADELMVNGLLLDDLAEDLEEVKKVARENIQNNTKDVYDLLGEPLI